MINFDDCGRPTTIALASGALLPAWHCVVCGKVNTNNTRMCSACFCAAHDDARRCRRGMFEGIEPRYGDSVVLDVHVRALREFVRLIGSTLPKLQGDQRHKPISMERAAAAWMLNDLMELTSTVTGRLLHRHHSSIITAVQKFNRALAMETP